MKQNWVVIRMIAAMAVIFASGVWVGHTFAPQKTVEGESRERYIVTSPGNQNVKLDRVEQRIVTYYRDQLSLDKDQFEKFVAIFLESRTSVTGLPKRSAQRVEQVRELHKKLRPFLRADQLPALDVIMGEVENKER